MWKKKKECLKEVNELDKQLLIKVSSSCPVLEFYRICLHIPLQSLWPFYQESFEGPALIVPDLESMLHLKEDGRKAWRPRLFTLRASGIYFVPKGKTKVCVFCTLIIVIAQCNVLTLKKKEHDA